MSIRPPAVAGSFYPDRTDRLWAAVEGFVAGAQAWPAERVPKAVIAPHAGYVYSGPVAGCAFAALRAGAAKIRRVVVIGPAHFVPVRGLAVPSATAFRTPLGDVPLDRGAFAAIAELPQVRRADAPHRDEHALEVELPFLQAILGAFALVPLVVGEARPTEVAEVLARLWGGEETLIVVSSDLSHYHDYGTAQRRDAATAAAIEALDPDIGPDDACGHLAIGGLLIEAKRRGLEALRLDLRSSGDIAGPRDRVVGYGAWALLPRGRAQSPTSSGAPSLSVARRRRASTWISCAAASRAGRRATVSRVSSASCV
jgi:MEMO1 family protein